MRFVEIAPIRYYLNSPSASSNPVSLHLDMALDNIKWSQLLTEISNGGGKYVDLNLSVCTGLGTFDPNASVTTGKNQIVSLALPNATTNIVGDFTGFSALKSISGAGIISIGDYAFDSCT